jgi:cell division protein FtsI (penicillin-binding protein 3)
VIGRWTRVRIALFGAVLGLLGLRVVKQAVQLQVREGPQLRELAEKNYLREMELAPRRGRILDRKGDELAATVDFDSVFCNPRQLAGVPDAARRLSAALGLELREVQRILGQPRYFAWLKRRATPAESAAAMALGLPGVAISKEPGRVYPKIALAATVLGHTTLDGRGVEGLEIAHDKLLRGSGVRVAGIRDSYGRQLLVEGAVDARAAAGHDLVVSLDKYITYVTERALAAAVEKHNAKSGVAVVMDPRNGEVLALASVPTYDPNNPRDALARGAKNRAIVDEFEPGSTMKTFTFAAAFDAGKLRPEDTFDCQKGSITIGKHRIRDEHPMGVENTVEVFKHSSNIGSIKIARRIGKEALYDALVRFGFGRQSGIGLPGERRGTLHHVKRWGEIQFATHAYGHGITATPLQLVAAFAAVASGGVYHPPRLALRTIAPDGHEEPVPLPAAARAPERVMSEKAARTMLKVMQSVMEKGATGYLGAIDGYPVAGKTGTAIKVINGRYDHDRVIANFVGIVPVDDPRLVIGVMVDEPQPIHYGGKVAAPAFKEIAEEALRYLGIPPSAPIVAKKEKGAEKGVASPAPAANAGAAAAELDELVEGAAGFDLPLGEHEALAGEAGADPAGAEGEAEEGPELVVVPSFTGMSIGEAIRAARRAGVELAVEGSGVAVGQSPPAGQRPRGSVCRVSFRPGG